MENEIGVGNEIRGAVEAYISGSWHTVYICISGSSGENEVVRPGYRL